MHRQVDALALGAKFPQDSFEVANGGKHGRLHQFRRHSGRRGKIDDKETLTDRQDKITHVAFERGYFDYPKRISLRELARMFEVSPSTLSEILRKGQRKIVLDYFKKQRHSM